VSGLDGGVDLPLQHSDSGESWHLMRTTAGCARNQHPRERSGNLVVAADDARRQGHDVGLALYMR
jgi:hypothetical protein